MSKKIPYRFKVIAGVSLLALALAWGVYLFVPTVYLSPADGQADVALGSQLEIHSSPMSQISKVAVYADEKLLMMEYNLGSDDLHRPLDVGPGQHVRVEAKLTSLMGVTREFVSEFTTVPPVRVEQMSVDGDKFEPGDRIPPQPTLTFSFNKPLGQAQISLDGSEAIDLVIDPADPSVATLPPTVAFKQGATHLLRITATALDSATLAGGEIRTDVVKPFSLYATVAEDGDRVTLELDASSAFADPAAVKQFLETDLPGASITVEKQKILLTCSGLDRTRDYAVKLKRAEGADGSFLEAPLAMTLNFRNSTGPSSTNVEPVYRGYVYTTSGPGAPAAPNAGASPTDSGPPPGWPSCCPWPPQ